MTCRAGTLVKADGGASVPASRGHYRVSAVWRPPPFNRFLLPWPCRPSLLPCGRLLQPCGRSLAACGQQLPLRGEKLPPWGFSKDPVNGNLCLVGENFDRVDKNNRFVEFPQTVWIVHQTV